MTDKLSREEIANNLVLRMAGEPVGYVSAESIHHLSDGEGTESTIYQTSYDDNTEPLYTEAQALAMYAAGAEGMRERVAKDWDGCLYDTVGEDMDIGDAIRALPITTTEGEQG